ncbi:MAG: DUF5985 family protein [Steroidobacteraceae bacterium]
MRQFLWGVLAMACIVVAVFFLHYWRTSRDRLFAYFSLAFAAMALDWIGHALVPSADPFRAEVYVGRVVAFVLIIVAIIDKNRQARRR